MTDGLIGSQHVTVPDLMDRVIAFRTLNYSGPQQFKEPNEFKVDVKTGKIVRNDEVIKEKLNEAAAKFGGTVNENEREIVGALSSPQYSKQNARAWKKDMVAECGQGHKHKVPDHNCSCGLYCYYDLKAGSSNYSYGGAEVHACVSVEGTLEAHTTGMRVEKMTVEAIYALSYAGLSRLCEVLEITFFPVESYNRDQFLMACREYGDPLPKTMRAGNQSDKEIPW